MSDTPMLEKRLRSFIAAPDDSDWPDVVRRADRLAAARGRSGGRAGRRRPSRPVLVAAVAVAAIAGAGVAIAAGIGAFNGISAAQHPHGPADTLDPELVAQIDLQNAELASSPTGQTTGQMLPASARFTRALGSGERVYALTTTTNELCVLLVGAPGSNMSSAVGCGNPLNQDQPTTTGVVRPSPATPPLAFGIAIDGVTSVSFMAAGAETTVPVTNNVWAYEGSSAALQSLTVHYADGTTETLTHGRAASSRRRSGVSKPPAVGQASAPPSASTSGQAHSTSDWRAVINDLFDHRGTFSRLYPCTSVRLARTKILAYPDGHKSPYLPVLDAYISKHC
jgi:hypothetical protein